MTSAEFETAVADMLRLAGYDVRGETQLGHKKIDLYAEERHWGRVRRIAVECKLYSRRLTQEQVNEIYANYRPLYDSNMIDEILLVTSEGIAPSSETMVTLARGLSHVTYADLQNTVIDFSNYLTALTSQIHDDGLASYYVRPKVSGDVDLEELVLEWMPENDHPLAILGSYGMGKTSFIRNLAAKLAGIAQKDPGARIPILIRLTEISAEQSLEGLLGRIFTTNTRVRNYNFDAFMELNNRGRFITFLDGFDEMKHTLVWDQFRYNFMQINRLIVPNSRVILLGRPTAFLSDAEHQYILHGIRRGTGGQVRDPEWPDYREIQLQPFSTGQVQYFLKAYTTYLSTSGKVASANASAISAQIARLPPDKLADLASRPVQLRILSEVLPQWKGDISELTAPSLYSTFIDIVIEREQEKITRGRFGLLERRTFARDLAYWLWTAKSAMSIDATQIPAELFPAPKGDDTHEGVRRDLVSACFLERKLGGSMYFPHRSFQEYLVAEKTILEIRRINFDVRRLAASVTPEVGEFLTALGEIDDFELFLGALRRHGGTMRLPLLQAWMRNVELAEYIVKRFSRGDNNPWTIILVGVAAELGSPAARAKRILDLFAREARRFEQKERVALALSGLMIAEANAGEATASSLFNLIGSIFDAAYKEFGRARMVPVPVRFQRFTQSDFVEPNVARLVMIAGTYPSLQVDCRRAAILLANELGDDPMILDWAEYIRGSVSSNEPRFQFTFNVSPRVLLERDFVQDGNALTMFTNRHARSQARAEGSNEATD